MASKSSAKAKVGVLGASGYTGSELVRLLLRHPHVELVLLTADRRAGQEMRAVFPQFSPFKLPKLVSIDGLDWKKAALDLAFCALPHATTQKVLKELLTKAPSTKVVDLSADFRLDRERYERYYQPHEAPALLGEAVYGLTELHRDEIRGADLVAAPGCYPTAALLALAPLREVTKDAVVDAKSGVSGAGREATGTTHFVSVDENVSPYGVEGHRHRAELEQELGDGRTITFTPHLVPLDQGLLASCYVTPSRELSAGDVRELFRAAYEGEPFVELADTPPGVRDVRDTNICRVHATVEPATGRVLAFAAIDNLWKGAAGQAVQDLNLMLGLPEEEGLA
jgi:N-acetyl-gamma-glutamyl-phosphate reductase